MRKNIARVLLYAACAVLVVFYILVLWWGKNPKVGTEYRMYYLTHELTDWPGYGNLKYTFGTKEICTEHKDRNGKEQSNVCSRKGQGWQKSKRYEGTKNTDKDSYIYSLFLDSFIEYISSGFIPMTPSNILSDALYISSGVSNTLNKYLSLMLAIPVILLIQNQ